MNLQINSDESKDQPKLEQPPGEPPKLEREPVTHYPTKFKAELKGYPEESYGLPRLLAEATHLSPPPLRGKKKKRENRKLKPPRNGLNIKRCIESFLVILCFCSPWTVVLPSRTVDPNTFLRKSVAHWLAVEVPSSLQTRILPMAEAYLKKVYYDPKHPAAFGGVEAVYRAAVRDGINVTNKQVTVWREQPTYTLHKPIRIHF